LLDAYGERVSSTGEGMVASADSTIELVFIMITFFISLLILLAAYIIYGHIVEKIFGIDPARTTRAIEKNDGR
jgi:hypothetical protein